MKKVLLGFCAILFMWVAGFVFVQNHMDGAPLEAHKHKRWWNTEVIMHFTNILGRYHYQPFEEHYYAVGYPCVAPEDQPCDTLQSYAEIAQFDIEDEEARAFYAVAPSDKITNDAVYTSFPPGGFVLSVFPVYGMADFFGLDPYQSVRLWNRLIQLGAGFFVFLAVLRLLPQQKDNLAIALLAVIPLFWALEPLHAHYTNMWSHQILQLILAIVFWVMTFQPSVRSSFFLGILCAIGCWIEWTSFLLCIAVGLFVLFRTPKEDKIKNSLAFGVTALMGGITLLFYYSWLVGLDVYFDHLLARSGDRSFLGSNNVGKWFSILFQGYGLWLLVLVYGTVLWRKKIFRTDNQRLMDIIFVAAFLLLENILMFEHSITYTFDRLKWGFLISFGLVFVILALKDKDPKLALPKVGGFCLLAACLSVAQYYYVFQPYWQEGA